MVKCFPYNWEQSIRSPSSALTQRVLGMLAREWQEKEIANIWIRKKEIELSVLIDDMIVFAENLKEPTKKPSQN